MKNLTILLILIFSSVNYLNAQAGPFIYNGFTYHLTPEGLGWEEAQQYAVSQGSNLITIENEAENTFLFDNVVTESSDPIIIYWIGLHVPAGGDGSDTSAYVWVDGGTSSYRSWLSGDPNLSDELGGALLNFEGNLIGWVNAGDDIEDADYYGIYKIAIPPVPTFSEWGLIILFLLFACIGSIVILNRDSKLQLKSERGRIR